MKYQILIYLLKKTLLTYIILGFSDNIFKLKLLFLIRARSSAVEHYGDIVGVAGSNPAAPTTGFIYFEF